MTDTLYMWWIITYSRCTFKVRFSKSSSPFICVLLWEYCMHPDGFQSVYICGTSLFLNFRNMKLTVTFQGSSELETLPECTWHRTAGGSMLKFLFDYFSGFPETLEVFCGLETYFLLRGSPTAQHLQLCQCTLFIARFPDMHFCQPASAEMYA